MASSTKQSNEESTIARGKKRKAPDQQTIDTHELPLTGTSHVKECNDSLDSRNAYAVDQLKGGNMLSRTNVWDPIHLFDGRGGGQLRNWQDYSGSGDVSSVHSSERNVKVKSSKVAVDTSCFDVPAKEGRDSPSSTSGSKSCSTNTNDKRESQNEMIDDAILTDGILALVDELSLPNIATCSSTNTGRRSAADDKKVSVFANAISGDRVASSPIIYYKQNDKWSCGFRNMQMILSALLPLLDDCHPYFQRSEAVLSRIQDNHIASNKKEVPSLSQLQAFLEQSWADGFDPRGAKHYKNRIRGRKSQIGAVEVSSTLSYLQIDSVVAQFILCHESRSLLGKFVWSYFTRKVGCDACFFCSCSKSPCDRCDNGRSTSSLLSTVTHATELLRHAEAKHNGNCTKEDNCCQCPLLPLYLQWEGHSVTIVGIKNTTPPGTDDSNSNVTPNQFSLLVFDPLKEGTTLKERLSTSLKQNDRVMENDESSIATMYLPVSKLLNEDCQIVMCSARPLSVAERQRCREKANAVTAASRAVGTIQG